MHICMHVDVHVCVSICSHIQNHKNPQTLSKIFLFLMNVRHININRLSERPCIIINGERVSVHVCVSVCECVCVCECM